MEACVIWVVGIVQLALAEPGTVVDTDVCRKSECKETTRGPTTGRRKHPDQGESSLDVWQRDTFPQILFERVRPIQGEGAGGAQGMRNEDV